MPTALRIGPYGFFSMLVGTISFNNNTIAADLSDGRTISVPIAWFPRPLHAPKEKLASWRVHMKKANILLGLVVLISILFSAPVVFARWQYEVFDTIKSNDTKPQSGDLYTAIGSDGTIHVIYFKDEHELPFEFKNVFYAYRDEAGWHNEDITQFIYWGGFMELRSISMGLDSNDYLYIKYDNGRDRYLLTNASGSWVTEPIEEGESYYASCFTFYLLTITTRLNYSVTAKQLP